MNKININGQEKNNLLKRRIVMKTIIILCLLIAGSSVIYRLETDTRFESNAASPEFKWVEVKAPGKGSHQQDWKPGNWPKGIKPIVAFNSQLWMTGQKKSWSSADGINWKDHDKKDWIERISIQQGYMISIPIKK